MNYNSVHLAKSANIGQMHHLPLEVQDFQELFLVQFLNVQSFNVLYTGQYYCYYGAGLFHIVIIIINCCRCLSGSCWHFENQIYQDPFFSTFELIVHILIFVIQSNLRPYVKDQRVENYFPCL